MHTFFYISLFFVFVLLCFKVNLGKAVELNSKLMRIDQKELQAELERAYNDFYSKVSMFCKA